VTQRRFVRLALFVSTALAHPARAATPGTWVNLGPTSAAAQHNGSTTLNVTDSGRVRTIVADGSRIFVASAGGGVWRSTDSGAHWTPITDGLASLSCGSLAMDPNQHNTLYLGLGDPFSGTGVGLVKSTDGGTTWSAPAIVGTSKSIVVVFVDPANSNVVLAGTNIGLFRSMDAGATWGSVSVATGQAEAPRIGSIDSTGGHSFVLSLEAQPSNTTTTDGQVWTSTDDGATWTRATGITKAVGVGRTTVAAAPSNRAVVYAIAANGTGLDLADVFKSTDGGRTWTALGAPNKSYTNPNPESSQVGALLGGQGFFNQLVLVSPTNANLVYFGGNLLLARTSDGGSTFTQVSNWAAQFSLPYVHSGFHAGTFDTSGNLYVGTSGGIFKSADGVQFTDALNVGLVTHQVDSVASSMNAPDLVVGALEGLGTRVRVGATGVFNENLPADGLAANVNATNANLVLASLPFARIFKSINGGATFTSSSAGIAESNSSSAAPFLTRLVAWDGSTTGNEVYTFSNLKIYKSTNYGDAWTSIAAPISVGNIRNVAIAASNAQVLGVVASSGRVLVSANGGATWSLVASGQSPAPGSLPNSKQSLSDIRFDAANPSILYVSSDAADSTASHLWKSSDLGASWTSIDLNGLPLGVPVNTVKVDSASAVYVGTHLGAYKSTDAGVSWDRFGSGMPNVDVTDIYISPDRSLVRAATLGRGFWQLAPQAQAVPWGGAWATSTLALMLVLCAGALHRRQRERRR
jgi:photosystem II stability/assembly factor-like uncharacterized protein